MIGKFLENCLQKRFVNKELLPQLKNRKRSTCSDETKKGESGPDDQVISPKCENPLSPSESAGGSLHPNPKVHPQ